MKKSHLMNGSVVGFALFLLLVGTQASAQKVITTTGKNSDPRTTNNPVVITSPTGTTGVDPATSGVPGTSTVPGAVTPTPTVANPAQPQTSSNPPASASPGATGVNGTTDVPTDTNQNGTLGGKSQVGGVSSQPKGGKRVGNSKQVKQASPEPSPAPKSQQPTAVPAVNTVGTGVPAERDVPVTATANQASQKDTITASPKADGSDQVAGQDKAPEQDKTAQKTDAADQAAAPVAASKTPCEDEAIKKINEILLQDTSGVLSNLYELTSRRLALRALSQGSDSLEGLVRKDIKNYEAKIAAMKNSEAIQSQVKSVYETYGKGSDLAKINADFDASFGKAKIACYWTNYRNNQRVWNEEASSYVLSLVVGEKDSGLTDLDAATIWTMEKVRTTALLTDPSYAYGKANGNLLNISTRVARYLGKIGGARNAKTEEINRELESIQKAVDQSIEKAYAQVKTSLYACIEKHNQGCSTCIADAKNEFESKRLSFDKIQRGLLQAVAKSENVKMEKSLKAKMGEVNFDLSDFAVGTVPEDHRKTISKVDACGNRIAGSTVRAKSPVKKSVRKPAVQATPTATPKAIMEDVPGFSVRYDAPKPIMLQKPKQTEFFNKAKANWEAAHPGETFPTYDPKKATFQQGR